MSAPLDPSPHLASLFHERGASWYWVLAGPLAGLAMAWVQRSSGRAFDPIVPLAFVVLVGGLIAVQVKAARIHTSVQLTEETLRQGTETIPVAAIRGIYPEPEPQADDVAAWQSARALGELTGVPRGRDGIGLRLTGGRTVQAWARRHRELRAALRPLVDDDGAATEPGIGDDEPGSAW